MALSHAPELAKEGYLVQKSGTATDTNMDSLARHWEAIVIGAGPAGAVSALLLARQGRKVLLVDKAEFPRSKVCGSCLSAKTLADLDLAGLGDLPAELRAAKISSIKLCTTSGAGIVDISLPVGLALSREALDSAIVARAQAAGAVFLPATHASVGPCKGPFRDVFIQHHKQAPIGHDQAGDGSMAGSALSLSSNCVIVADGLNGQALSGLDFAERDLFRPQLAKGSRIGAGTIVAGSADANRQYQSGIIYMALHRSGYVGLVRMEDDRIDLGAAFDPSFTRLCGSPQAAARQILHGAGLPYLEAFDGSHWLGTAPFTRRRDTLAGPRLFVVGDAASYGEPFTGEGIAWAVYSALLVVPKASAALQPWVYAA